VQIKSAQTETEFTAQINYIMQSYGCDERVLVDLHSSGILSSIHW
jgi:hypothetical protein